MSNSEDLKVLEEIMTLVEELGNRELSDSGRDFVRAIKEKCSALRGSLEARRRQPRTPK